MYSTLFNLGLYGSSLAAFSYNNYQSVCSDATFKIKGSSTEYCIV